MEPERKIPDFEDFVNDSLTMKARECPKFQRYIHWLKTNGAIFPQIEFPVAFGRFGYIGATAKEDIPKRKAIIFIPNRLIISTHLVKSSPLSKIISQTPELFSPELSEDSDFNILSLFVLCEKLKGKASFYSPMFDVSEMNYSLLNWETKELESLEDPMIFDQVREFQADMQANWERIREIMVKNGGDFMTEGRDLDKDVRKIYFWAYEFVMTRCYGWSLPSTILIPLADFLNHGKNGVDHYMIHEKFELNEAKKHPGYNIKHRKVDLSLMSSFVARLTSAELERLRSHLDPKASYIEENFEFLKREDREAFCVGFEGFNSARLRNLVQKVNLARLQEEERKQIYHYQFFETSDEEDNDTDEEDDEKINTKEIFEEKPNGVKKEEEKELKLKAEENRINLKILKLQKEDEEEKAYQDYQNEREDESLSEIEDEENWEWYSPEDPNIYFIVTTSSPYYSFYSLDF